MLFMDFYSFFSASGSSFPHFSSFIRSLSGRSLFSFCLNDCSSTDIITWTHKYSLMALFCQRYRQTHVFLFPHGSLSPSLMLVLFFLSWLSHFNCSCPSPAHTLSLPCGCRPCTLSSFSHTLSRLPPSLPFSRAPFPPEASEKQRTEKRLSQCRGVAPNMPTVTIHWLSIFFFGSFFVYPFAASCSYCV